MPRAAQLDRIPAAIAVAIAAFIVLALLPACGTQQGTIEGQVLGMYAADQQPKILSDALIQVSGSHGDQNPVHTDANGKFHMTLPYDNYNLLASADGYQPREKTVQLNSGNVETVGFVLVAPGIQEPSSPPPLTPQDRQALSSGSAFTGGYSGSFLNDPWFWFWMFDRPYYFGYPRIPFVTYGSPVYAGGHTVIVIDHRTDPTIPANQRGYTSYRDPSGPAVPGTKPAPQPVAVATGSKGATKPGVGGAAASGAQAAPVSPPSSASSGRGAGSSSSGNRGASGTGSTGGRGLGAAGSSSGISKPAPVAPPSSGFSRGSSGFRGGSKGRR